MLIESVDCIQRLQKISVSNSINLNEGISNFHSSKAKNLKENPSQMYFLSIHIKLLQIMNCIESK